MNNNTRRLRSELLLSQLWYIANGAARWERYHPLRPTRTSIGKGSDESPATIDIDVPEDVALGIKAHTLRFSRQDYIRVVEKLSQPERRELSAYFLESQTMDPRVLRRPYPIWQKKGKAGYQVNLNKRPTRLFLGVVKKVMALAVVL